MSLQTPEQLVAELYNVSVADWDGEIDFYRELAPEVKARGKPVLEIACGTGRVTLRLAQEGVDIKDVIDPQTNQPIRKANAWTFERSTQNATVVSRWEEFGEDGAVLQTWERQPMRLHGVFRFEMEHLLARAGFEERLVYGDFFRNPLSETSSDMIWVARKS